MKYLFGWNFSYYINNNYLLCLRVNSNSFTNATSTSRLQNYSKKEHFFSIEIVHRRLFSEKNLNFDRTTHSGVLVSYEL